MDPASRFRRRVRLSGVAHARWDLTTLDDSPRASENIPQDFLTTDGVPGHIRSSTPGRPRRASTEPKREELI